MFWLLTPDALQKRSSWQTLFRQVGGSFPANLQDGPRSGCERAVGPIPQLGRSWPSRSPYQWERLEQGSRIRDRSAGPARSFFSFIYLGGHVARGVFQGNGESQIRIYCCFRSFPPYVLPSLPSQGSLALGQKLCLSLCRSCPQGMPKVKWKTIYGSSTATL